MRQVMARDKVKPDRVADNQDGSCPVVSEVSQVGSLRLVDARAQS